MTANWLLEGPEGSSSLVLERKLMLVGSGPGSDLRVAGIAASEVQLLILPEKVVVEAQVKGVRIGDTLVKPGFPAEMKDGDGLVFSNGATWMLRRSRPRGSAIEPVLRAVELLLESPDPSESLPKLLEFSALHLSADEGVLLGGQDMLEAVARWPEGSSGVFSKSAVKAALERHGAVLWADSGEGDAKLGGPSLLQSDIRSILCAPIKTSDEDAPLGCLYFHRTGNGSLFLEEERKSFQRFVETLARVLTNVRRQREDRAALEAMRSAELGDGILAFSPGMQAVLAQARRFAAATVPVLILGETGTGKEKLAQLVHRSSRRNGPFVAINCAAIPASLMESELFGHEKGAFTGATSDREGLFEAAKGGTLFLDEIGELAPHLQAALLRALQEKVIRRVGSTIERQIDVRVVAATHRDLDLMVQDGRFRQDLFFRINVACVRITALRDRHEDILPLARVFVQKASAEFGMTFGGLSRAAEKVLLRHGWPGNVRELENCMQRSLLEASNARIQPEHLGLREGNVPLGTLAEVREAAERRAVDLALSKSGGNLTQAAAILGIDRKVLRDLLKRLGMYEGTAEPD
ncbi:MAG: sigma-54-dependent Fis family transcriptional regulator [Fibrobacterota bacterium]